MNNNDTIRKTLIVAVSLCLVCSALISFSAVELRDLQEANKTLDKQSKILSAAGLLEEDKDVSVIFNSIQARIVNLETGLFDSSINLEDYEESSFSRNPETSIELNSENDLALLKRRENFQTIYLHYDEDKLNAMGIELPVEPQPIANYVPGVRTGNLLYLSGLGPSDASMVGKVGKDLTKDEGYEAAKSTGIGWIARLKGQVGDLDKVKRIVK